MKRGTSIHFHYTKHREITYQITSTMFLRINGTEISERRKQSKKGSPLSFWTLLWEAISTIDDRRKGNGKGNGRYFRNHFRPSVLDSILVPIFSFFLGTDLHVKLHSCGFSSVFVNQGRSYFSLSGSVLEISREIELLFHIEDQLCGIG